jgi:hypothetical protein
MASYKINEQISPQAQAGVGEVVAGQRAKVEMDFQARMAAERMKHESKLAQLQIDAQADRDTNYQSFQTESQVREGQQRLAEQAAQEEFMSRESAEDRAFKEQMFKKQQSLTVQMQALALKAARASAEEAPLYEAEMAKYEEELTASAVDAAAAEAATLRASGQAEAMSRQAVDTIKSKAAVEAQFPGVIAGIMGEGVTRMLQDVALNPDSELAKDLVSKRGSWGTIKSVANVIGLTTIVSKLSKATSGDEFGDKAGAFNLAAFEEGDPAKGFQTAVSKLAAYTAPQIAATFGDGPGVAEAVQSFFEKLGAVSVAVRTSPDNAKMDISKDLGAEFDKLVGLGIPPFAIKAMVDSVSGSFSGVANEAELRTLLQKAGINETEMWDGTPEKEYLMRMRKSVGKVSDYGASMKALFNGHFAGRIATPDQMSRLIERLNMLAVGGEPTADDMTLLESLSPQLKRMGVQDTVQRAVASGSQLSKERKKEVEAKQKAGKVGAKRSRVEQQAASPGAKRVVDVQLQALDEMVKSLEQ